MFTNILKLNSYLAKAFFKRLSNITFLGWVLKNIIKLWHFKQEFKVGTFLWLIVNYFLFLKDIMKI